MSLARQVALFKFYCMGHHDSAVVPSDMPFRGGYAALRFSLAKYFSFGSCDLLVVLVVWVGGVQAEAWTEAKPLEKQRNPSN